MHQTTPDILEILRSGAGRCLEAPEDWVADIDAATIGALGTDDPVTIALVCQANRNNIAHWAMATYNAPGQPVPPNLGPEMLRVAREQARLGVDDLALNAYRAGQNAAWLRWMDLVFELTTDAQQLRAVLDISARSISAFLDATIAGLTERIEREKVELSQGSAAEKQAMVDTILKRRPVDPRQASRVLGYRLETRHSAAILFGPPETSDTAALNQAAVRFAQECGGAYLLIAADHATCWLWLTRQPTLQMAEANCPPGLRLAIGPASSGIEGFRESHETARLVQSFLASAPAARRVADYETVRLISVITPDRRLLKRFINDTLGDLAKANPSTRSALLAYLKEGSNIAATAERLGVHRNTLMRRIGRAEDLLPGPLDEKRFEVAIALEAMDWQGNVAIP
ncbi:CdaR family transcriptional regulator [Rhizobium sp. L1K21]|uniref:PucR family transcriptional regulator n=1 Tax=Rhizobium sp. L1K21 TaxID=2954933 RepID=UPI0020937BD1|nr:helix-turn-helix domain-containing protein [Rhizobium sp. L1K21]MCO6186003.1 helix-turn-helix domain-containing protein [Rhizobium sp. L1K21]